MYKVVLVDDEQLILEGLRRVMPWRENGCEVVGVAHDGQEGLVVVRALQPDILFTDIRMPNMDGLTMAAALRSEFPRMQITVLTAFRDFDYAQSAIRFGVCRYLLKPSKMDELEEALSEMRRRLGEGKEETEEGTEEKGSEAGSFLVSHALQYMREHCAEHLSLSDVAEHVYVSQWHLSKLLNRHTGQSFFDLIAGMRVDRAKLLLADPAMRVQDVAYAVGYQDVAHFSRSFKKIVGRTPGEFRDSLSV
ncbi:MAG: response regulator [Clostridia bacterium]|nr:response regulator [Clostridia bacterium]